MYLLDTVVLSELRKSRRDAGVTAWIGSVPSTDLYLSAVTIGEVELGIERQRHVNSAFAMELTQWLETVLRAHGERILAFDTGTAKRWGRLAARIGNKSMDLAIAATALEHGLTVVTRNEADFQPTGVLVLNPFRPSRPS